LSFRKFLPVSRIILCTFNHLTIRSIFSLPDTKESWLSCSWILRFDQEANKEWRFCLAIIKVCIDRLTNVTLLKIFSLVELMEMLWCNIRLALSIVKFVWYDIAPIILVFIYFNVYVSYDLFYICNKYLDIFNLWICCAWVSLLY
jgi:hypothetical protein